MTNAAVLAAASQQAASNADLARQLRAKGATSARTAATVDVSASGASDALRSLVKQG